MCISGMGRPGMLSIPGSTGSPGMGHPRNPRILGLPSHGMSQDGPRNPGILNIPGSTGFTHMGHPGIIPGILGY